MDQKQKIELDKLAVSSDGLLDRVVSRLAESEEKNRSHEKAQRNYIVKIANYYKRQLQICNELLTDQGVPQWVENLDSHGVPGNSVTERLRWYLARRKNVKPSE